MENTEENSPLTEEELSTSFVSEEETQQSVEETTAAPEPEPEPKSKPTTTSTKSKSSGGGGDSKFEQWWSETGEDLVQKGFSKKSLIVRVARHFSKEDTVLYNDVVATVGAETVQNSSVKEACREVAKKIK